MKKRTMALLAAMLMIVGVMIGSTLAWLTAKSDAVVNTFTASNIKIDLTETTGSTYKMVPGCTIKKDPTATVKGGSEDCFLFVKIVERNNFSHYMTYEVDTSVWTKLEGESGVYYKKVNASSSDQSWNILKDKNKEIKVNSSVTKADMTSLTESTYPKLEITAYATQLYETNGKEFAVADAWAKVKPED